MHDLVVVINLDQHSLFVAQRHKLSSTHDTTEPHTPAPPNVINAASKKQARKQAGPQTHGGTRSMISALVARLTGFLSHQAPLRLSMGPADSAGASVSSAIPEGAERCTVAAGCFWGTEHLYRRHFGGKGLLDARVGYIGGDVDDPSYRAVCGGKTGHAEAAQIIFDPEVVSYRQLLEFFYRFHDPTTLNRQGPDAGTQYRSAIYFHGPEQERIARDVTRAANQQWWKGAVVTELVPAGRWWSAEDYHQLYLDRNAGGYECPSHFLRNFPPLRH